MRRPLYQRAIAGLDLSLRCPAVCIIPAQWELGEWKTLHFASFPTDPIGFDGSSPEGSIRRIAYVVEKVFGFVGPVDQLFVEQYAFSQAGTNTTKLAELGGAVRFHFWNEYSTRDGRRVLRTVTASQARKLLWGAAKLPRKGAKKLVQQALRDAGAPFRNDDEADAFVVANFGLCALGLTYLTLA